MTDVPPECAQRHSKPDFIAGDPHTRSVVRFLNPQRLEVEQIRVDGCVFQGNEPQRCDWLVNVDALDTSIFVELKGGSHPERALPQLHSAHRHLENKRKTNVIWLISRLPPNVVNTTIIREQARLAKQDITLQMKNSPFSFTLKSPAP